MDQWRKDRARAFMVALQRELTLSFAYIGYVGDVWDGKDGATLCIDGDVSEKDIDAALDAIGHTPKVED